MGLQTVGTEYHTTYKKMNEDIATRNILDKIRSISEKRSYAITSLNEIKSIINEENSNIKAVAITDDPRFVENVLSNQIEEFRSSVEGGAQFNKPEQGKVEDAPLVFMPETGNLVFGGVIPCLNNMRWQFVLKTNTGNGCFIWSDGLILSDENIKILQKLFGFYKNWKSQWEIEGADLERMAKMLNK